MTLLLDPDIRDWVVLPLFVIIVVAGLLRQQVSHYLLGSKTPIPPMAQRVTSLLQQCSKIRSHGPAIHALPTTQWQLRKQHVIELLRETAAQLEAEHERNQKAATESTELNADGTPVASSAASSAAAAAPDPMEAMMKNPMSMMGGNMVFMVQNMVMMQGIQHFFSGFILLRIPFPLTVGFKNMFQKGMAELPNLESSYVSSVSWYFLVMYGLRSFFKLVTGTPSQEQREQDLYAHTKWGLQMPPNPSSPKQDTESLIKLLLQEADNLELLLLTHKSELDGVEKRLLGNRRYPKRHLATSSEADFLLGGSGSGSASTKKGASPNKALKKKQ